jgi:hypothetical protein
MVLGGTTIPKGKPVMAKPGQTPRSPLTMVEPVLVTVEPPRTAKLSTAPSPGEVPARAHADTSKNIPTNKRDLNRPIEIVRAN